MVALAWVSQRQGRVDVVVVAAADPRAGDVTCVDEVVDDRLGGALRDLELVGEVAKADLAVLGDCKQRPGVVGQERPLAATAS